MGIKDGLVESNTTARDKKADIFIDLLNQRANVNRLINENTRLENALDKGDNLLTNTDDRIESIRIETDALIAIKNEEISRLEIKNKILISELTELKDLRILTRNKLIETESLVTNYRVILAISIVVSCIGFILVGIIC
jgi:hypothetical protein